MYPGNVAKFRLEKDLHERLSAARGAKVLDVGCVGPSRPLDLWERLLPDDSLDFHLTGIDVHGIEETREMVASRGWSERVAVVESSAYDLGKNFPAGAFDIVVSTQVLEHLARYRSFLHQVAGVTKDGGGVYLTFDSAHHGGKFSPLQPLETTKRIVKKILSLFGWEGNYDIPLYDCDLEKGIEGTGLTSRTRRFHNLSELKRLHNHLIEEDEKDVFLERWWELEDTINRSRTFSAREKALFRGLYYHLVKVTPEG